MDSEKVTQVLADIFRRCEPKILCDRTKFEANLLDLLNERNYPNERAVLRQATKKTALLLLAEPDFMADGLRGRVIERLTKENQIEEDDAKFVVDCIIAARRQAEGTLSVRIGREQTIGQKATLHTPVETGLYVAGDEHWKSVENHLFHLEEQLRDVKEKNALRLKAAVIAFCLTLTAVFPGWRVDAPSQEIESSQQTDYGDFPYGAVNNADSKEDTHKSSVFGPVQQQTQDLLP